MNDTNVGLGMVDHRKGCRCIECQLERAIRELADVKQSVIDLQSANAAYVRANSKLRAEARAAELVAQGYKTVAEKASDWFAALEIAHHHLDMAALRVSHPKDAATIEAAIQCTADTTPVVRITVCPICGHSAVHGGHHPNCTSKEPLT